MCGMYQYTHSRPVRMWRSLNLRMPHAVKTSAYHLYFKEILYQLQLIFRDCRTVAGCKQTIISVPFQHTFILRTMTVQIWHFLSRSTPNLAWTTYCIAVFFSFWTSMKHLPLDVTKTSINLYINQLDIHTYLECTIFSRKDLFLFYYVIVVNYKRLKHMW